MRPDEPKSTKLTIPAPMHGAMVQTWRAGQTEQYRFIRRRAAVIAANASRDVTLVSWRGATALKEAVTNLAEAAPIPHSRQFAGNSAFALKQRKSIRNASSSLSLAASTGCRVKKFAHVSRAEAIEPEINTSDGRTALDPMQRIRIRAEEVARMDPERKRVLKVEATELNGPALERVSRPHGADHARWQQRFVCLHGGETAGRDRHQIFDGSTGAAARDATQTADGKATVLRRNRPAARTDESENVKTSGKDCNAARRTAQAIKYPAGRGAAHPAPFFKLPKTSLTHRTKFHRSAHHG